MSRIVYSFQPRCSSVPFVLVQWYTSPAASRNRGNLAEVRMKTVMSSTPSNWKSSAWSSVWHHPRISQYDSPSRSDFRHPAAPLVVIIPFHVSLPAWQTLGSPVHLSVFGSDPTHVTFGPCVWTMVLIRVPTNVPNAWGMVMSDESHRRSTSPPAPRPRTCPFTLASTLPITVLTSWYPCPW